MEISANCYLSDDPTVSDPAGPYRRRPMSLVQLSYCTDGPWRAVLPQEQARSRGSAGFRWAWKLWDVSGPHIIRSGNPGVSRSKPFRVLR